MNGNSVYMTNVQRQIEVRCMKPDDILHKISCESGFTELYACIGSTVMSGAVKNTAQRGQDYNAFNSPIRFSNYTFRKHV